MTKFYRISLGISILASLYLGVIGLFQFDFLKYIFKMNETFINFIYIFFGICGIINIQLYRKNKR